MRHDLASSTHLGDRSHGVLPTCLQLENLEHVPDQLVLFVKAVGK